MFTNKIIFFFFASTLFFQITTSISFGANQEPYIILVGGGSASGKTFVADKIVKALGPERAILLSADNYYEPKKQPEKYYRNGSINFDHPSAVNLEKLGQHLKYLKAGFPVSLEEYTFGRHVETPTILSYKPIDFIVVEGIFALYPEIAKYGDFKIFVDVDKDIRLQRRVDRDQRERGFSRSEVEIYFNKVVEPMHQKYVQPSGISADVVVTSPNEQEKISEIVKNLTDIVRQNQKTKYNILAQTYDEVLDKIAKAPQGKNFRVLSFNDVAPTQTKIGFERTVEQASIINDLVRKGSIGFDLPSELEDFLRKNPINVVERNGRYFAINRHPLALALHNRGANRLLVEVKPADYFVFILDRWRFEFIDGVGTQLTWEDLKKNPPSKALAESCEGAFKRSPDSN